MASPAYFSFVTIDVMLLTVHFLPLPDGVGILASLRIEAISKQDFPSFKNHLYISLTNLASSGTISIPSSVFL